MLSRLRTIRLTGAEALSALRRAESGLTPSISASFSGDNVVLTLRTGMQKLCFVREASECVDETLRRIGKKVEPALLGPAPKKKPAVTFNEKGEKVVDKTPPKPRVRLALVSSGNEIGSSGGENGPSNLDTWRQAESLLCHELCPDSNQDLKAFSFPVLFGVPEVGDGVLDISHSTTVYTAVPQHIIAAQESSVESGGDAAGSDVVYLPLWFTASSASSDSSADASKQKAKKQKKSADPPAFANASDLAALNSLEFIGTGEGVCLTAASAGKRLYAAVIPLRGNVAVDSFFAAESGAGPRDPNVGIPHYLEVCPKAIEVLPLDSGSSTPGRSERFPASPPAEGVVRFLTYNILYDGATTVYSTGKSMYPYAKPEVVDIAYRKQAQIYELLGYNPCVVCLQEMQSSLHETFFAPRLASAGHEGIHLPKLGKGMREGTSIFFKVGAFDLVQSPLGSDGSLQGSRCPAANPQDHVLGGEGLITSLKEELAAFPEKAWIEPLVAYATAIPKVGEVIEKTSTVAQIIALRERATGRLVVVGNTHLWFHPKGSHIRVLQLYILCSRMADLAKAVGGSPSDTCFVLCGDLNCQAKSAPYRFMVEGELLEDHPAWDAAPGFDFTRWDFDGEVVAAEETASSEIPALGPRVAHHLGLSDATPQFEYTNFTPGFTGRLDYVMHSANLAVASHQPLPDKQQLAAEGGGVPSTLFPSDHLPVCVDLRHV